jgi:uncharacterized protein DUF4389
MTIDAPLEPSQTAEFYPVDVWVERPQSQSRLTNFPFLGSLIRAFLLIPHFIVLYFLQIVANIVLFIASFAILFTGKYPRGLFNFYVGYMRWSNRMNGYLLHLYDRYPPFSIDDIEDYPLRLGVQYPEKLSRLLNFPILGLIIKAFLAIPHLFVLVALYLVALICIFISTFAILFTGAFPAGMHSFVVRVLRWGVRVNAYIVALTDRYPPFSLS